MPNEEFQHLYSYLTHIKHVIKSRMRKIRHVACMEEMRTHTKSRHKWMDNTKLELIEKQGMRISIGLKRLLEGTKTGLFERKDELSHSIKVANILTSSAVIKYSRKALHNGVFGYLISHFSKSSDLKYQT